MALSPVNSQRLISYQSKNATEAAALLDRISDGDQGAVGELALKAGISKLDALDAAKNRGESRVFSLGGNDQSQAMMDASRGGRDAAFNGASAGATVRHLGGFRADTFQDPQVRKTVAALTPLTDPSASLDQSDVSKLLMQTGLGVLQMAPSSDVSASTSDHLLPLNAAATRHIVALAEMVGATKIAGVPFDGTPEFTQAANAALRTRRGAAQESKTPDTDLNMFMRLNRNGAERMSAHLDTRTGKVVLSERTHALPRSVEQRVDSGRSKPIVDAMLQDSQVPGGAEHITAHLAETFPADALQLLGKADVKLNVLTVEGAKDASSREIGMLGEKAAQAFTSKGDEWSPGNYSDVFGEVRIGVDPNSSEDTTNTVARHEMAHALDHVLGDGGDFLSNQPEFRAIYDETQAATDAGEGSPAFPTDYSGTDPQELFAESAAIFLGTHTMREDGMVQTLTTREDLQRTNPKLYIFVAKVFAERVPAALQGGRIQGADSTPANQTVSNRIDELRAIPEKARTGAEWMQLSRFEAIHGAATGDHAELQQALADTKVARKKARIFGVPIPVISGRLAGQQKQIEANLQGLSGSRA